jgi:hypothetical protein
MRRWLGPLLAASALLGSAPSAEAALTDRSRISTSGLGPLKLGMTLAQAERATGRRITPREGNGDCDYGVLHPRSLGVEMLTTRGRIAVVYVSRRGIATRSGARVRDTPRRLRALYGSELVSVKQFYNPRERGFEVRDGSRKVRFSVLGGRVSVIAAGRKPEVDYLEACS